jgi:hypothetical protein
VLDLAIRVHKNSIGIGQPMTFHDSPWLDAIYRDPADEIVIKKSVQCGISEWATVKTFYLSLSGLSVMYVLPGDKECSSFVFNRITPLLTRVKYYADRVGATDNVRLKKLGAGTIKFANSNSITDFTEIPIQAVVVDEKDHCNQKNLSYVDDRMASAMQRTGRKPIKIFIGNPTVGGYGISKAYAESDAKEWMIKCGSCGQWQKFDWIGNVIDAEGKCFKMFSDVEPAVVCRHCHKSLDRHADGEWVAEHLDNPISGYHISQLFTKQASMADLYAAYQKTLSDQTERQRFWNSILGEAYTGEGDQLTAADIDKCVLADYHMPHSGDGCAGGIDVGKVLHVRIDQLINSKRRAVFIGIVPNFEEAAAVLKRYNCRMYVIDARPEMHKTAEFIKANPGGFMCEFHPDQKLSTLQINKDTRTIKINRTVAFDEATADYLEQRIEMPIDWRGLDGGQFLLQMMAPTRMLDEERTPPAYVWDEGGQADHHRLADLYCHLAAKLSGFGARDARVRWI